MRLDYFDSACKGTFGSKYLVSEGESTLSCARSGVFRQPVTVAARMGRAMLVETFGNPVLDDDRDLMVPARRDRRFRTLFG